MDWWQLALDTRDWFAGFSLEDTRNFVLSCAGVVGMPYLAYRTGIAARQAKTSRDQLAATMEISHEAAEHNRKGQNLDRFRNGVAMLAADSRVENRGGLQVLFDLAVEAPGDYLSPVEACFCEAMRAASPVGAKPAGAEEDFRIRGEAPDPMHVYWSNVRPNPGAERAVAALEVFAKIRALGLRKSGTGFGPVACVTGVDFSACNLERLDLDSVSFIDCDFSRARVKGCSFHNCVMRHCAFNQTEYMFASFGTCAFMDCRGVDPSGEHFDMPEEDKLELRASGTRRYIPRFNLEN